jgi:hypothetical protein
MHNHFMASMHNKSITFSKKTCQNKSSSIEECLNPNCCQIKQTAKGKAIISSINMTKMAARQIQIEAKVKAQEDLMPAKGLVFQKLLKLLKRVQVQNDNYFYYFIIIIYLLVCKQVSTKICEFK